MSTVSEKSIKNLKVVEDQEYVRGWGHCGDSVYKLQITCDDGHVFDVPLSLVSTGDYYLNDVA